MVSGKLICKLDELKFQPVRSFRLERYPKWYRCQEIGGQPLWGIYAAVSMIGIYFTDVLLALSEGDQRSELSKRLAELKEVTCSVGDHFHVPAADNDPE